MIIIYLRRLNSRDRKTTIEGLRYVTCYLQAFTNFICKLITIIKRLSKTVINNLRCNADHHNL